jgi:hypothetical protein
MLWHSPAKIIARLRRYIVNGTQETVINSVQTRLEHFAAVRHRVVHDQSDSRAKFDAASVFFTGRRYDLSRPGKFLRDNEPSSMPQRKWIDVAIAELTGLLQQMV